MAVVLAKERWTGQVAEMTIGLEPNAIKIGGESTLPFLPFEGSCPNQPVLGLEVWDMEPGEWPEVLKAPYAGVLAEPVAWARKCADIGAGLICLRLISAHPEQKDTPPEEAAATALAVAEAVNVPLVVLGCGEEEKDADLLAAVARALAGKNVLLGCATANNYKAVTASCIQHGHSIIASSPLDINLAKQLNILISEMNLPLNRIAIDPMVGPLGYGLEYAYSIMERARISALTGDKMLAMPVICFVGSETWKTKEARTEDSGAWGEQARRAVLWEALTAVSFIQAGADILILRHPESFMQCKAHIAAMAGL